MGYLPTSAHFILSWHSGQSISTFTGFVELLHLLNNSQTTEEIVDLGIIITTQRLKGGWIKSEGDELWKAYSWRKNPPETVMKHIVLIIKSILFLPLKLVENVNPKSALIKLN